MSGSTPAAKSAVQPRMRQGSGPSLDGQAQQCVGLRLRKLSKPGAHRPAFLMATCKASGEKHVAPGTITAATQGRGTKA